MKTINVTDVSKIKNELNKYKKGKKLDIQHFNQAARLAWLGKVVLCRLDPEDPDCHAYLLYMQRPEGLAEHLITLDEEWSSVPFLSQIHILDAEQGDYLAAIFKEGMDCRARELEKLNQRDFYFEKFFKPGDER